MVRSMFKEGLGLAVQLHLGELAATDRIRKLDEPLFSYIPRKYKHGDSIFWTMDLIDNPFREIGRNFRIHILEQVIVAEGRRLQGRYVFNMDEGEDLTVFTKGIEPFYFDRLKTKEPDSLEDLMPNFKIIHQGICEVVRFNNIQAREEASYANQ